MLLLLGKQLQAQLPFEPETLMLNGFAKEISGPAYHYHSSISIASDGMLIRADDGLSEMTWETDVIPYAITEQYVTFVWLTGIGSSPGFAAFDLQVNGKTAFTIKADGKDEWLSKGEDGSSLFFRKDMIDQYDDRFGFMYLTLPVNRLEKGKPVRLTAVGGRYQRSSWFMIFSLPMQDGLSFKVMPAYRTDGYGIHRLGLIGMLHLGKPSLAKVFVNDSLLLEQEIVFGYNYLRVNIPSDSVAQTLRYRVSTPQKNWEDELVIRPARKWRLNFVQHSHTDIGYTRPQTEILAEHLRYIDYALDFCDNTDSFPEEAKFRWTCEASWAVSEYLRSRPANQIQRLKRRIAEKRIEVTGMYFNFDEIPGETVLAVSLQPLKMLIDSGMQIRTAMQNDVNGIAWCMNDYFFDMGIKYLNMGTHGHRALICFDQPTLFWWESPSGKKMLAFRAEHYMTGNTVMKIHAGDFNIFEEKLLNYLVELEEKGYPFDLVSIQHSGFLTDNSPPSLKASEMIMKWNETYTWPKLQTSTASAFFEEMESLYADQFQHIRGAWPDWWTDGFGASAREVAAVRKAQSKLSATTAALGMAAMLDSKMPEKITHRINEAYNALLFYSEHTVGYHASVSDPFHPQTMEQRAIKESYAWEAARRTNMLNEEAVGLLQSHFQREATPAVLVFNTLSWTRSGLFIAYIDHQILPRHAKFSINDHSGHFAKAQAVERHSDGTYWAVWVDDVPAFGFRKYFIDLVADQTNENPLRNKDSTTSFENRWYKIKFDFETATISSLIDKSQEIELIDQEADEGFGAFIYETLGNRGQMEQKKLDDFKRMPLDTVWFAGYEPGAVWNSWKFAGNSVAAGKSGGFQVEYRVFNTSKRIDIQYYIDKKLETNPEAVYFSFPWKLDSGQLAIEVAGGEMRPGADQIKGSSNDWNTMQQYVRLFNQKSQLVLHSIEAPLLQAGGINTGRYTAGALPASQHVYGWPMNNYWVTNFNADQHGGHFWTYSFSSFSTNKASEAARFGWSAGIPLVSRVLPGGGPGDAKYEGSFVSGFCDNVMLINMIPDQDGTYAFIHLRETEGKKCVLNLYNTSTGLPLDCVQIDASGQVTEENNLTISPLESKFFKIKL